MTRPARSARRRSRSRERPYIDMARLNGIGGLRAGARRRSCRTSCPIIAASFVTAVSSAMLATIGLEALGLGPQNELTLGMMIYWAQSYTRDHAAACGGGGCPRCGAGSDLHRAAAALGRHGPAGQRAAPDDMSGAAAAGLDAASVVAETALEVSDLSVSFPTPEGRRALSPSELRAPAGRAAGPRREVGLRQVDHGPRPDADAPRARPDRRRRRPAGRADLCWRLPAERCAR